MFSLPALILRNLAFHWRGNLAVMLGVAVGSAVLTGALLVGDSLRGSLRSRAERQLGGIDHAALFMKPVRASVADGMPGTVAPVLLLNGSLQAGTSDDGSFLARATILGVDERFAPAGVKDVDWKQTRVKNAPVVLGHRVAEKLRVKAGDTVRLGVPRFSDLPRSSSIAKRSVLDSTVLEPFTVAAVLPPDSPANDFNLSPNPAAPMNVFVPIGVLANLVRDETDRSESPLANALFAFGSTPDELNAALRGRLELQDYGLKIVDRTNRYASVESDQLVLPPNQAEAVERGIADVKLCAEPTIVYVADSLAAGDKEIPYPVVAGLNAKADAPLGPFLPPGVSDLRDDEVVLLDWKESPFAKLPAGSKITLKYFHPDVEGEGRIETAELTLRGSIPLARPANDRYLTPEIRGVTDDRPGAGLFSWDRPPMLPKEKIKARVPDDSPRARFWNNNKATPMAYVNLATAKRFFAGRYGTITSIRVAPGAGENAEQTAERLGPAVLKHLDPAASGLVFDPIRERLLTASRGGTDFGGLFLGFSCFLIAAALMLVGLLFRLALDRRAKEIGVLLATGYSVRQVRGILLWEGMAIAATGAALGLLAGMLYNALMLKVLLALWPDPEIATFLKPHASATSFAIGFGSTGIMAMAALWFGIRGLVKIAPPALLRGETGVEAQNRKRFGINPVWIIGLGAPLGLALILAGGSISNPDFQAMSFFGGGAMLLAAGLAGLSRWLKSTRHREVRSLPKLGVRNASRNPGRSLLTAALLASASFLLVAVESFRREPGKDFDAQSGGSGGFNLIGEADVPLYELAGTPLAKFDTVPLRLRTGDDASCLNLFQASRPKIIGVPNSLIQRGGFQFYETAAITPEEKANPWLMLNPSLTLPAPDDPVPVFCEQNTAMWMLKTAVGGIITVPDDSGRDIKLKIVGTFADSPFQSELIMSDDNFVRLFPKQDGYRMFLVRVPPTDVESDSRKLERGLRRNGFVAMSARERVAGYQAVVGAYLSTFQLLGGFGLLLGVLGLAVVLLRGVWERLGELALLRAVGYRTRALQFLVLAENAALLAIGIAIGVLAALASVAPHVAQGAEVPWARLAGMLALVIVVGLGVASAATAGLLRVPVIPALRRE
jgi:ABC-type antimicrobial peptide transport system permease subunit